MVSGIDRDLTKDLAGIKGPQAAAADKKIQGVSEKEDPRKKAAEEIHKQLHDKPQRINSYKFNKVQVGDEALDGSINKILQRYSIDGSNKFNSAVLSDDGNTLVIATDGKTALKESFGGRNIFMRAMNMIFGWIPKIFGAPDKRLAAKRYKKLFAAAQKNNPEHLAGEPLKHLVKGLSHNHYHAVTVFHKDPKSGKFAKNPDALGITDSYYYLLQARGKIDGVKADQLEDIKKDILNYYSLDKIIPMNDDVKSFTDVFHQIAEGLYQTQGYDLLTIPGQIHQDSNVDTNDLNYVELDWHRVVQTQDHKWKIFGDKKLVDERHFPDDKEREDYMQHLVNFPQHLTIVRPKEKEKRDITEFLGHLEAWSQMYSGNALRTRNKKDHDLIERVQLINSNLIKEHDVEQRVAEKVTEKLEKPEPKEDDKNGFLQKLMSSFSAKGSDDKEIAP